jgi:hypothetical protein
MPVLQGDNSAGQILGGIAGTVGAFLNAQQQAKRQKADDARQAALDAQTVAEAMWRHQEEARRDALAQGEFDLRKQKLTDDETQTAQDRAAASAVAQFQSRLNYPTNWNKMKPEQQIAYLRQRLNREQRMPGAEKLVAQTQKEIEDIQRPLIAAANQAAMLGRTKLTTETQARDTDVRENHEDWRTMFRVQNRPSKGGTPSANNLTPQGQAFMDMLTGSNNPASPREALNALHQSHLPAHDQVLIQAMLESPKMSKLYTVPNTQSGDYQPPQRPQRESAHEQAMQKAINDAQAAVAQGADPDQVRNQLMARFGVPKARAEAAIPP